MSSITKNLSLKQKKYYFAVGTLEIEEHFYFFLGFNNTDVNKGIPEFMHWYFIVTNS